MAIRRNRNRRRILIAIIVVAIVGAIGFSIFNIISLKREQSQMREQQEALEKEKAQMEKELSEINDPENLENQARDQLRLIKEGEYLYIFPEEITKAGKDAEKNASEEE
ncbi:MAG: septum formation initiator family protein [Anaerovoracaceae bacterium]|nr:septum formation initiator family protein [Anaerovoracaceae bacterium]